jgi:hypothetical protein
MPTRIQDNTFKAIFLFVLFIVLILKTIAADARMYRKDDGGYRWNQFQCAPLNTDTCLEIK